jgi:hypothetical protein
MAAIILKVESNGTACHLSGKSGMLVCIVREILAQPGPKLGCGSNEERTQLMTGGKLGSRS